MKHHVLDPSASVRRRISPLRYWGVEVESVVREGAEMQDLTQYGSASLGRVSARQRDGCAVECGCSSVCPLTRRLSRRGEAFHR